MSDLPPNAEKVALIYRDAADAGKSPVKAVAAHFGIPYSTAGKWVIRARQGGFLAPTRRGLAPIKHERCPTCGADRSRWRASPNDSLESPHGAE